MPDFSEYESEAGVAADLARRIPTEVVIDDNDSVLVAFATNGSPQVFDPDTLRDAPRRASGATTVATAESLLQLIEFSVTPDQPIVVRAHHPSSLNADVDVVLNPSHQGGHGRADWSIALRPGVHPRFVRWAKVAGSDPAVDIDKLPWLTQRKFADQLLDHSEEIVSPDRATVANWARGIAVQLGGKEIVTSDRRSGSAHRDVEILQEVVGDAKPTAITINVPFFVTRDAVNLGLEIDTNGANAFRFRWVDRDEQLETEIASLHELIVDGLPANAVFVHV